MTQNDSTVQQAAPLAPTNVPFNLIIATSVEQVRKIAKHFDLSDVRNVEDLKLPAGGAKRGDALQELLGKVENTVTLAVITDSPWVQSLLSNSPLSSSVWRSIESQLLGHRTSAQRNFIVVANAFNGSVREAEAAGLLETIVAGQPLPHNWKPAPAVAAKDRAATRKPAAQAQAKKSADNQPRPEGKKPQKTQKVKTATHSGVIRNPEGFKARADKPQQIDRSKRTKPAGNINGLHDDLYLLAKGHYGPIDRDAFLNKAAAIIAHHTGSPKENVGREKIVLSLFNTLIAKSNRGYWGGFNLLKEVIVAGSDSALELVNTLNGWISTIPATDGKGEAIPQPKVNQALQAKLGPTPQARPVVVPEGQRDPLPGQDQNFQGSAQVA